MKIAMLVPSLIPTGPVRVAIDLAKAMKDDAEVDFFYFDKSPATPEVTTAEEINFIDAHSFENYDILHTHGIRPDSYVWYHSRQIKCKTVSTLHNYVEEDLSFQYNKLVSVIFSKVWQFMAGKHDALVAISEDMRNYYRKLWNYNNIEVVPNTRILNEAEADPEVIARIQDFKGDSILLSNISYVTDRKGLDQIIRVLPLLPGMKFLHIGDGKKLEDLKLLAEKLQVQDRCLFLGSMANGHLYIGSSDLFVFPSRSEAFGLVLLEAVQMKIPVVCSDLPVLKDAFSRDEVTFFELENIAALQKAIESGILNGKSKSEAAFDKFEKRFSPSIIKDQYLDLYRKLISHE